MAAVTDDGNAYGPGPHEINNRLIDAVHHAIRLHPSADAKANYAKILAQLTAQQAKAHAAQNQAQSAGHAVNPPAQVQPPGMAEDPNRPPGYIAQNLSPLEQALVAAGGSQNIHPVQSMLPGGFGPPLPVVPGIPVGHTAPPPIHFQF
jgi:hypothetical protein